MKTITKILAIVSFSGFLFASCYFDVDSRRDDHSTHTVYNNEQADIFLYHLECYHEPYETQAHWCDLYSEAECCTWNVDGWYEEWCDWNFDGCWEYNRSF